MYRLGRLIHGASYFTIFLQSSFYCLFFFNVQNRLFTKQYLFCHGIDNHIVLISKQKTIHSHLCCAFFFFFFGPAHGTWKFLGQGLNLCHRSDLSHSSDNTGFLTLYTTRKFPHSLFLKPRVWCVSDFNPDHSFAFWSREMVTSF